MKHLTTAVAVALFAILNATAAAAITVTQTFVGQADSGFYSFRSAASPVQYRIAEMILGWGGGVIEYEQDPSNLLGARLDYTSTAGLPCTCDGANFAITMYMGIGSVSPFALGSASAEYSLTNRSSSGSLDIAPSMLSSVRPGEHLTMDFDGAGAFMGEGYDPVGELDLRVTATLSLTFADQPAPVPLPATALLTLLALGSLMAARRSA